MEECDFQTAINEKYDCPYNNSSNARKLWNEIILEYRNSIVVENILKDKHNRIAMIYGSAHMKGIIEITAKKFGNEHFTIEKEKMIISSKVDGKEGRFIFDTGASGSLITDTTIVNNFSEKEKSTFGMMKDAQRNQIKKVDFLVDFENGLFSGSPKLFAYYQIPGNKEFDCLKKKCTRNDTGNSRPRLFYMEQRKTNFDTGFYK